MIEISIDEQEKLEERLNDTSLAINRFISDLLPEAHGGEDRLIEAIRYSVLQGGKRLRPFLVVETARLFGVSLESSLQSACAIEFVHCYSLIHDDLPAMDDDDLRRGKPSCHKQFDEATAILAGDGLLTYAFEVLADKDTHHNPEVRCELVTALAKAAGCNGMAGGQMMDLIAENQDFDQDEIIRLQRLKTGALFSVSCEMGAILGRTSQNIRHNLIRYANALGLAFQMTDDILDAEGNRSETGKTVQKDEIAGKATLVGLLGKERAKEQANMLVTQAIRHLDSFDRRADILRLLAKYVVKRRG